TSTPTVPPDLTSQTGPPPRISPSTARTPSSLVLRCVATGCPKTERKITAPLDCTPPSNTSALCSAPPHLLHASANRGIGSQSGDAPRCGPETPAMAASPSTTTSIPPPQVFLPPTPHKGSQTPRTPRPESDVLV